MSFLKFLVTAGWCWRGHGRRPKLRFPPEIAARSYLLLDVTANQILAAKDVDSPLEPASLTKLMTAYLVFDALKLRKLSLTQPCR